jgi:hypothetical protein
VRDVEDTLSWLPSAAPIGGITPVRPSRIVALIASGVRPTIHSASVRFGKPREPRASVPWHCAQLFMNSRSPIVRARHRPRPVRAEASRTRRKSARTSHRRS